MKDQQATGWPTHLRAGAVRFGRTSQRYDETIAFYRDLVGLPVVGEFAGSFGEDGTIFGLPDTTVQLEVVRAHDPIGVPPFDQLVLYLDNAAAVDTATSRLQAAGATPNVDLHPYWAANGAVSYHDPDGREVVFAPWVYGRDPEPAGHDDPSSTSPFTLRIEWYEGDRAELRRLFAEADDSARELDSYINDGQVLVALQGAETVGHLQLISGGANTVEVKNMAVASWMRGAGIGRALVDAALREASLAGATRALVATATADVGNLRFYQRCGFRFLSIERDAFTEEAGYEPGMLIDGVELRDRVWLEQRLAG